MFLLPVLKLRLLCAVRHPHVRNMPSWVPDWAQPLPINRKIGSMSYSHEYKRNDQGKRPPAAVVP